eukprot:1735753-Amphidinium_carterae.1
MLTVLEGRLSEVRSVEARASLGKCAKVQEVAAKVGVDCHGNMQEHDKKEKKAKTTLPKAKK